MLRVVFSSHRLAWVLVTALFCATSAQAAAEANGCKAVAPCLEGESGEECLMRIEQMDTPLAKQVANLNQEECRLFSVMLPRPPALPPDYSDRVALCRRRGVELPATAEEIQKKYEDQKFDKKAEYKLFKQSTISLIHSDHAVMAALACKIEDVPDRLNEPMIARLPETCICDFLNKKWIVWRLVFTLLSSGVPDEYRRP